MSRFRNSSISLKNIYLRTFVIRFSAVSYGTYSIEIFCQYDILWRTAVWRLWHLPYPTHCNLYLRHLLSEIICVPFYIGPNRFVNFSRDCLSSSNVHIKFVSLLAAVSQMHVFGKNFLYVKYDFAYCVIICLCCMWTLYCEVRLFWCRRFHFWWVLNIMFTDIYCN